MDSDSPKDVGLLDIPDVVVRYFILQISTTSHKSFPLHLYK